MTADEILVGIDNSPSARAARWAAGYPRSTGTALRAIDLVDWPEALEMSVYPVVANYVYPTSQAGRWGIRQ
jgi:hypothetical protein